MLTPDQELDLRWFFTEARGDCGLRSTQSGIEFRLNSTALGPDSKGATKPENPMHVSKGKTHACFNFTEDRIIEMCESGKPGKASAIMARLRKIHPSHAATLEAQFCQQEIPGAGVSPLLVSKQPLAVDTYRDVIVRHARRKRKTPTPTNWMWLHALINTATGNPTGEEARILGTILSQARTSLSVACEAYVQAR